MKRIPRQSHKLETLGSAPRTATKYCGVAKLVDARKIFGRTSTVELLYFLYNNERKLGGKYYVTGINR